jgi:hypothetical protein
MLFEVTESEGVSREIELFGRRVTIGRDPTSDIILDDSRCSRLHAVIERSHQGMVLRDAGSRNGVFVNGRLVRRSPLRIGDEILIGNALIRMLADRKAGSTSSDHDPDDVLRPEQLPHAGASSIGLSNRRHPLTISLLTVAWWLIALSGVASLVYALTSATEGATSESTSRLVAITGGLLLAVTGVVLGTALLARASWARSAHLLLCGAGLASCILTLPSAILIVYFLRPQSERIFDKAAAREKRPGGGMLPRGVEVFFSLGLLLSAALSVGLAYAASSIYLHSLHASRVPRLTRAERATVDRLRRIAEAEESFRRICNTGYADLSALLHPATVIPDYPNSGPAFIATDLAFKRAGGYQFELMTEELMPAAVGCPTLRYRRYRYSARPLGGRGRHFLIGPENRVHVSRDRPATFDDPFIPR